MSVRDMIEAMIAGQHDPEVLAGLARGRMKAKRAALIEVLTGRFDDRARPRSRSRECILYGSLARTGVGNRTEV